MYRVLLLIGIGGMLARENSPRAHSAAAVVAVRLIKLRRVVAAGWVMRGVSSFGSFVFMDSEFWLV